MKPGSLVLVDGESRYCREGHHGLCRTPGCDCIHHRREGGYGLSLIEGAVFRRDARCYMCGLIHWKLWEKMAVARDTGCWEWRGFIRNGYGTSRIHGSKNVHRWAYIFWHGRDPDGLDVSHLCHNRRCCNPDHLVAETRRDNMQRSGPATRTHCPYGHPYDEDNTYRNERGRTCRACHRNYQYGMSRGVCRACRGEGSVDGEECMITCLRCGGTGSDPLDAQGVLL